MGLRFRRTIKLFPGVRLNVSKGGVSASIGVRGAHVTIGRGRVRETVGLPGSGLSYTHTSSAHEQAPAARRPAVRAGFVVALFAVVALVAVLAHLR